ncbi:hypothetical protein ACFX1T_043214 [Malus domestica]
MDSQPNNLFDMRRSPTLPTTHTPSSNSTPRARTLTTRSSATQFTLLLPGPLLQIPYRNLQTGTVAVEGSGRTTSPVRRRFQLPRAAPQRLG